MIEILPVAGLPEVRAGDDLAALVAAQVDLRDGDVVVVAQKVVSKAEGAVVALPPGADVAAERQALARRQAARVVVDAPWALVVQTAHGLVCANAGIDASNTAPGTLVLLPDDPDASARRLREGLREATGAEVGVVVSDTFGRPWRLGQTDVAIGVAGLAAIRDERGTADREGRRLEVTETAVADELAGAADLVRRKADGVPVVVVRGLVAPADDGRGARALVRDAAADLFPRGRGMLAAAVADAGRDRPATWVGPVTAADRDRALAALAATLPAPDADPAGAVRTPAVGAAEVPGAAPTTLRLSGGDPMTCGIAAGLLAAALVDLGYAARAVAGPDGVVVEAGHPRHPR